jgi:hypothetical protein
VFLSDEFVKLGDFGLSKDMGTASFTSTYVGVSPCRVSQTSSAGGLGELPDQAHKP